ncbi:MAG TPA: hypothetical protein VFU30_07020 [Gaiellaceae bacterium]|nr:hypothetical protein [Gaiellaceae bacterium]
MDDIVKAGGTLRVPVKDWRHPDGVDYATRARLAEQFGKVPLGKRLAVREVSGELELCLEEAPEGTVIELSPVEVPRRVSKLHPVARRFRDDTDKHEVSRKALPRCVRIVHALAEVLERRGHDVANVEKPAKGYRNERWKAEYDGHLLITIRGHEYSLRVLEEKVSTRSSFEDFPHSRAPGRTRYDSAATGRLQITADRYGRAGRPAIWADRRSGTLEKKLPELVRELEVRAAEDDHRDADRKSAAEERHRQWEVAMTAAGEQFREERRGQVLRARIAAWQEANLAREYLQVLCERYGDYPESTEWIAWTGRYIDEHIDPMTRPPTMAEEPEPAPDDLKPFLGGLSPYGPPQW